MSDQPIPSRWTDEQVEHFVGNLLRYGVMTAALVAFVGGVFYLVRYGSSRVHYGEFKGEPAHLTSVAGVLSST